MLSPQSKNFHYNSPKQSASKEKFCFLAKTCSSSALRSEETDRTEEWEGNQQAVRYSKLLKQKDLKILNLLERVKAAESELSSFKNGHSSLSYDLQFFKSKLQEEFYRNVCLESELELINGSIKGFIIKIVSLFDNSDRSLHSFAKHLESIRLDDAQLTSLDVSKKLLSSLDFQIAELGRSFYLLKREPEVQRSLVKSADLKLQSYKLADQAEKEALRNHISTLIDYYETRMVESDDYQKEIANLRNQREFVKELLISSEKEKNEIANEVYEVGRREYQVDFERMNRSALVKLCMGLFSKLKDLDHDRRQLEQQLELIQTAEKGKYESMLKMVKKLEKNSDKKLSMKRMAGIPFN